jgi:serine/threonine-protein kinase RsbT
VNDPPESGVLTCPITSEKERFWLVGEAMRLAASLGLGLRQRQSLGIVVAELVSNAAKHAGGGRLRLWAATAPDGRRGVRLVVEDEGPGIPSLDEARRDGFSEGRWLTPDTPAGQRHGLGVGLGAVYRLADEVVIAARPGGGTVVSAVVWAGVEPRR